MGDQLPREHDLGRSRKFVRALIVKQDQLIVVGAKSMLCEIGGEQRHFLAPAFCIRVSLEILRLGGEADAERRPLARRNGPENIGICLLYTSPSPRD